MTTALGTPEAHKVVADAQALGDVIAADALTFAHSVIGHVAGSTPGVIADVSAAALAAFYDAVPGGARGTVQAIVGGITAGAVSSLDAAGTKDVLGALGLATSRLNSWFATFTPPK